jgi:hypothetical protein
MLDWLKKRKLSDNARKKLMIAMARAEDALIETHVSNILEIAAALQGEVEIDRAAALYLDRIELDEGLAGSVTNRLLARLDPYEAPARGERTRFRRAFSARG